MKEFLGFLKMMLKDFFLDDISPIFSFTFVKGRLVTEPYKDGAVKKKQCGECPLRNKHHAVMDHGLFKSVDWCELTSQETVSFKDACPRGLALIEEKWRKEGLRDFLGMNCRFYFTLLVIFFQFFCLGLAIGKKIFGG